VVLSLGFSASRDMDILGMLKNMRRTPVRATSALTGLRTHLRSGLSARGNVCSAYPPVLRLGGFCEGAHPLTLKHE
jgi:hypothetical protein